METPRPRFGPHVRFEGPTQSASPTSRALRPCSTGAAKPRSIVMTDAHRTHEWARRPKTPPRPKRFFAPDRAVRLIDRRRPNPARAGGRVSRRTPAERDEVCPGGPSSLSPPACSDEPDRRARLDHSTRGRPRKSRLYAPAPCRASATFTTLLCASQSDDRSFLNERPRSLSHLCMPLRQTRAARVEGIVPFAVTAGSRSRRRRRIRARSSRASRYPSHRRIR